MIAHMYPYITSHPPHSLRLLPRGRGDGTSNNVGPQAATIEGDVRSLLEDCPKFLRYLARTSPHRERGAPRGLEHLSALGLKLYIVNRMVGPRPNR